MFGWIFRNRIFLFLWAAFTGFLFAIVWKEYEQTIHATLTYYRITPSSFDYEWAYRTWLDAQGFFSTVQKKETTTTTNLTTSKPREEHEWLRERIPVLCVVFSKKVKQSKAVKNTWSKHCNRAVFYGDFNESTIPINKIKSKDNWMFVCQILRLISSHEYEQFKWVLLVGDRTYAIVENLRYMVAGLDSNDSFYLGHAFRDYDGQYNVEDAGYVLSRGAVDLIGRRFADVASCSDSEYYWHDGDRTLGQVFRREGIRPRDTRDMLEKSRFLPFNLEKLLIPGSISVFSHYWRDSAALSPEGSGCCSDFAITLTDVPGDKMYMLEYIIYHLKPVSQHWPPSSVQGHSSSSVHSSTSKPQTTTTKRVTGKAFVADLSSLSSKKKEQISGVVASLSTSDTKRSKNLIEQDNNIEVIVASDVRSKGKSENVVGGEGPIFTRQVHNGHMNKDREMAAAVAKKKLVNDDYGVDKLKMLINNEEKKISKGKDDIDSENFYFNGI